MTEASEQFFSVERDGNTIPGMLWLPAALAESAAVPLVLMGHGGNGHKQQDYVKAIGRSFAKHHGIAAAAIDGPVHGDRRADKGVDGQAVFNDFRATFNDPTVTDGMIADWKATLDHLLANHSVLDADRVGYWGLSMGTMFGLPFTASESRVKAAVLGLMGTIPSHYGERLAADAPKIAAIPVLFLAQWDDELVPREDAIKLFGALATKSKTLHVSPGKHADVPPSEMRVSQSFLASHLAK